MTEARAVLFHGPGRPLEFVRAPLPEPRGAEMLVRVRGCTLCGSDLHTRQGRRQGPVPVVLGHEIVGEIAAFGESAPSHDATGLPLRVGDAVVWSIVAHCGACFYCLRGLPQKCEAMIKYGHEAVRDGLALRGGLADFCLLAPGGTVVRLPEDIPLAVACPASCATATVAAATAAAGTIAGRRFGVMGLGMLGLTAIAMLQRMGADCIVGVDPDAGRLARAEAFGADYAVTPHDFGACAADATGTHGLDAVLELSGSDAAFEAGMASLRLGGTMVLVGAVFPTPPVSLSMERIVRRNLTIRGVHNYEPGALAEAVRFLAENNRRYPFEGLVARWFPLEDAEAAFQLAADPSIIRIGVRPG